MAREWRKNAYPWRLCRLSARLASSSSCKRGVSIPRVADIIRPLYSPRYPAPAPTQNHYEDRREDDVGDNDEREGDREEPLKRCQLNLSVSQERGTQETHGELAKLAVRRQNRPKCLCYSAEASV